MLRRVYEMYNYLVWAVLILLVIVLLYWLGPGSAERFNTSYYQSSLEKDMDYLKNNKGYTVNDNILAQHIVHGTGIESPF